MTTCGVFCDIAGNHPVLSLHRSNSSATGKTQRRQQLVVCASNVRRGKKSEQQGRARAAPSRERASSGNECKGAEVQAIEAHLGLWGTEATPLLTGGVWFAKSRTSDSASRSQAARVQAEGDGGGRERREARSRGARPTATKGRDWEMAGRSECAGRSWGRAAGAQFENGEETTAIRTTIPTKSRV